MQCIGELPALLGFALAALTMVMACSVDFDGAVFKL